MLEYDDTQLQKLYAEMEPKRRKQALKGAFRREANNVRKAAIETLHGLKKFHATAEMDKGIRSVVFSKAAGFRVTVGTKKASRASKVEYGFYTNRRGLKKPVLIWAEDGTAKRQTHSYKMWGRKRMDRKRKGHSTGKMPAYRFMYKTRYKVKDQVTENVHRELILSVGRIARKYGCNT